MTAPNGFPGHQPEPRSALQWFEAFTRTSMIPLPVSVQYSHRFVSAKNMETVPPGTPGNPDLRITLEGGKQFYLKMFEHQERVFYPLEEPTLYWPVSKGAVGAFWIVSDPSILRDTLGSGSGSGG